MQGSKTSVSSWLRVKSRTTYTASQVDVGVVVPHEDGVEKLVATQVSNDDSHIIGPLPMQHDGRRIASRADLLGPPLLPLHIYRRGARPRRRTGHHPQLIPAEAAPFGRGGHRAVLLEHGEWVSTLDLDSSTDVARAHAGEDDYLAQTEQEEEGNG